MRYLVDNMFNGLVKELTKKNIDCETVIHAIWNDEDSAEKGRWDAQIFRFLLEKKYGLVSREKTDEDFAIITADKDLERYCIEFGINRICIPQPKPLTKLGYKALGADLADQLERKT